MSMRACVCTHTHTHTHTHIFILSIWLFNNSYVESMQLVFRLGTLGNENFGVLWNQFYCPLAQTFGARRRRRRIRHMGLLFSHAFVEAHAGYTAAAAASPYKQISCYKTCLSHTRRRRMIFDFRRSCFCPQVVTNRLLLVVGGKKSLSWLVMTWFHYYYYYHLYDIRSMCNNFWRSFDQIEPPPTSCTMQDEWFVKTGLQSDLVKCEFDKHYKCIPWYEISFTNDTLVGVRCFKCQFFFHSFVHQQNDSYKC